MLPDKTMQRIFNLLFQEALADGQNMAQAMGTALNQYWQLIGLNPPTEPYKGWLEIET